MNNDDDKVYKTLLESTKASARSRRAPMTILRSSSRPSTAGSTGPSRTAAT